ncbi:MAG: hypothetical protein U9R54_03125, partial [Bacteroidota bacterium]|nr:hypothetical protein [Bacteroidota bacterium]
ISSLFISAFDTDTWVFGNKTTEDLNLGVIFKDTITEVIIAIEVIIIIFHLCLNINLIRSNDSKL